MEFKKTLKRLKPYNKLILLSVLLSLIFGITLFITKQNVLFVSIGSILPLLSAFIQILLLEREFAVLLSVSIILLSVTYYTSVSYFKKSLQALNNFNKTSSASFNLFIVLLSIITFLTIIGAQYSMVVKHNIDKKTAPRGVIGKTGDRGENGDIANNILDEETIIIKAMKLYSEKVLKIALRQRYQNKEFPETNTYLWYIFIIFI